MPSTQKQSLQPGAAMTAMQGGMTDQVMQTQAIFRAIMDAMARPGTIKRITTDARPPQPLSPLSGAVLATLADGDTPLWLGPQLRTDRSVTDWLTFHVGAPIAVEASQASFAVLEDASKMPALEIFAQGRQDYPDRSATLILQVEQLSNSPSLSLSGPGIKTQTCLGVERLSPLFLGQWADNTRLFPRGVDLILVAPDALACLPRTTIITSVRAEEN